MNGSRLSACLIARNERENVHDCLASFAAHVDEIVFVDTGSRDGTVAEVRRVAREHGWTEKLVLGRFKWRDDFAAARNHAAALATGDVHVWVDLDDRLMGAEHVRIVTSAFDQDPQLGGIMARYAGGGFLVGEDAEPVEWMQEWRERLMRAPARWQDPTWERPIIMGEICSTSVVWWWHRKTRPRGRRDLLIARRWVSREPENWRALQALAGESADTGDLETAVSAWERAATAPGVEPRMGAGFVALAARALLQHGRLDDAERMARRALGVEDPADGPGGRAWLVVAGCELKQGNYHAAREAAAAALACDLVRSQRQDCVRAGLLFALAEAGLGRDRSARDTARDTLELVGVSTTAGPVAIPRTAPRDLQRIGALYELLKPDRRTRSPVTRVRATQSRTRVAR